jgi:hypothetical protein
VKRAYECGAETVLIDGNEMTIKVWNYYDAFRYCIKIDICKKKVVSQRVGRFCSVNVTPKFISQRLNAYDPKSRTLEGLELCDSLRSNKYMCWVTISPDNIEVKYYNGLGRCYTGCEDYTLDGNEVVCCVKNDHVHCNEMIVPNIDLLRKILSDIR